MKRIIKKAKKGFTLVELVVVIAIIAILGAVSVIGYFAFIDDAKESNDLSLTKQINTALQADSVLNGAPATMSEAVERLKDRGIDIESLEPYSEGSKYVWDAKENQVLLLDKDNKIYAPQDAVDESTADTFVMVDSKDDIISGYGAYLTSKFADTDLEVKASVDTGGKATNITLNNQVSDYSNVIINTNGGTVTVDAPKCVVNHYGFATKVEILAVKGESYHEYGYVTYIDVTKGRVVIESGSTTNGIYVNAGNQVVVHVDNAGDAGKIGLAVGATATITGKETPKESDAPKDLFISSVTKFAGGDGSIENPFLITNAKQLTNIAVNDISELDVSKLTNYKIAVPEIDATDYVRNNYFYGNLDGEYVPGKNAKIKNLTKALINYMYPDPNVTMTVSNIDLVTNIVHPGVAAALTNNCPASNLVVDNVNVKGTIRGNHAATYISFGPLQWQQGLFHVTFKNCISEATLSATGGEIAGFIKHSYCDSARSSITLIDSAYIGKMNSSKDSFSYITSNSAAELKTSILYSKDFLKLLGINNPVGTLYNEPEGKTESTVDGMLKADYPGNAHSFKYIYDGKTTIITNTEKNIADQENGTVIEVTKSVNAIRAEVTLFIGPNNKDETGNYVAPFMNEEIDLSNAGATFTTETIKKFNITVNSNDGKDAEGVQPDGITFNVKDENKGTTYASADIKVIQYDNSGGVVSVSTFVIKKAA